MEKCSSCGTEVASDVKFCPSCGGKIMKESGFNPVSNEPSQMSEQYTTPTPMATKTSGSKNKIVIIILAVIAVVGIGLAGMFLYKNFLRGPESVAKAYCKAVGNLDIDAILDVVYTGDKKSEMKALFESLMGESELKDKYEYVSCKINETEDISSDELADMEEDIEEMYESKVKIKEAKRVSMTLTMKNDGEKDSADEEVTVVKINGKWYVYSE